MDTSSASSDSPFSSGTSPAPPATAPVRGLRRHSLSRLTVVVAALVIAADQFTKWLVINHVNEPVHLFWTLRLVKAYNTGTAFSLGVGLGPFIGLLAVGVVLMLARLGRAVVNPVGLVALGLVMGGAVGNLLDRLFRESHGFLHGAVVDFIDFQWWPVFNLADSAIVVGGLLLAVSGFGADHRAPAANPAGSSPSTAGGGPYRAGGTKPAGGGAAAGAGGAGGANQPGGAAGAGPRG